MFRPVIIFSFYLELYKNKCRNLIRTSKFKGSFRGQGQLRCKMPHSFKVLMSMSSHFQESPPWNYFYFQFDDMKYTFEHKELTHWFPSEAHEFPLKIFYGGLFHWWLYIFNNIKVYWNVWVFDYVHSSFFIDTGLWLQ